MKAIAYSLSRPPTMQEITILGVRSLAANEVALPEPGGGEGQDPQRLEPEDEVWGREALA